MTATPQDPPPRQGITPLGTLLLILVGLFLLAVIVLLCAPLVLRAHVNSDLTESTSNARQLGMALTEFEHEYGRFPDAQTAATVAERTNSTLAPPGTTANAHLRQLIASGILTSEFAFYAKTSFTRLPDNNFNTRETALAPGEVGFGYLLNGDIGLSAEDNPSLFLLCAPLAFDGKTVSATRLDPKIHHGRMVMLRIDNSAITRPINPDTGDVLILGKSWLATGDDTIWGSKTPRITPPEPK